MKLTPWFFNTEPVNRGVYETLNEGESYVLPRYRHWDGYRWYNAACTVAEAYTCYFFNEADQGNTVKCFRGLNKE